MRKDQTNFIEMKALGRIVYYEGTSSQFFLEYPDDETIESLSPLPSLAEVAKAIRPTAYTFCVDVSDACNLRCDYCFNPDKRGRTIDSATASAYLERMFAAFPGGEKYFVDMSGKGEPLLALRQVLEIADWCHRKQDEIRREVLPQFVCNGTLLTPEVARVLQSRGILFGVSLDGEEGAHDRHRRDADGRPTFERVLRNVRGIEFRDYVGCAATLTKDVFPLLESVEALSGVFRTLSYRPARGPSGFDGRSEMLWEGEYDRLALKLLEDMRRGDDRLFLCLMNGEDYFGRFLYRIFGSKRTITRCDAGISRFALDLDGNVFPCPSCSAQPRFSYKGEPIFDSLSRSSLARQISSCRACPLKTICGGECPIEQTSLDDVNSITCSFRRHLIALAGLIEEKTVMENPVLAVEFQKFAFGKAARYREDKELRKFLDAHPEMSFTKAKKEFDSKERRY